MAELLLPAVFWPNAELADAEDALVTLEDGCVLYITRADGFAVRLLLHELDALHEFVITELASQAQVTDG